MRYAEAGFDLEIDLTRESIDKVATDPDSMALFLGGQGASLQILWDRVAPEVAPLSPDNVLIFSAGLLTATPVPGANRTSVSSIDPQSNLYVNSGFAGYFGPELKHAGYDKIVISGRSAELAYLWIHNDQVEIRDATHLRGKSSLEAAALIRQELDDDKIQVAAIGLAGENRVYQSSIDHANTSASRGVGAVMGDKMLKAIAVRGTKDVKVAHPAELFQLCQRMHEETHANVNCGDILLSEADDAWHVKNPPWRQKRVKGFWDMELQKEWEIRVEREELSYQWENYSQELEEVRETVVEISKRLRGTGCYGCSKECHEVISLPGSRKYFLKSYTKLAYTLAAYKDLQLNYEILAALQNYGLDEFSMPPIIAFAVELYDVGILTDEDLPGFPADAVARFSYLIEKIAHRDGVGDALAMGVDWAARHIGKGAEVYDRCIKKIEQVPLNRDTANDAYFLMLATGEKTNIAQIEGAFPQSSIPDKLKRAEFVRHWDAAPERFKKWFQEWEPTEPISIEAAVNIADWSETAHYVDDSLGICPLLSSFRGQYGGRPPYHLHNLPKFVALATGLPIDSDGLWRIAARTRNLVRAINVARGLRKVDEYAPSNVGGRPELESALLDAYYRFKGWTKDGIPTRETLDSLGLGYVSEEFANRRISEVSK